MNCCYTYLQFKNICRRKIKIMLVDDQEKVIQEKILNPREKTFLSFKEGRRTVPGGLGYCIKIKVITFTRNDATPLPKTWKLCCDKPNGQRGAVISYQAPRENRNQRQGDSVAQAPVMQLIKILRVKTVSPCPVEKNLGAASSPDGIPYAQVKLLNGLKVGPRKWTYGAGTILRFFSTSCRDLKFVQGVNREVYYVPKKGDAPKPMAGYSHPKGKKNWKLDVNRGAKTPFYPYTKTLPGGGIGMVDYPGIDKPWNTFKLEEKSQVNPKGSKMIIRWRFRTWVICLKPGPKILGHFNWNVTVEFNLRPKFKGKVIATRPTWSKRPDIKGYHEVLGNKREWKRFRSP